MSGKANEGEAKTTGASEKNKHGWINVVIY